VATSVYRDTMVDAVPEAGWGAVENVAGATSTAAHLPPEEAGPLLATAFEAYTSGVAAAAATGAGTLLFVALVAAVSLRRLPAGTGKEPAGTGPDEPALAGGHTKGRAGPRRSGPGPRRGAWLLAAQRPVGPAGGTPVRGIEGVAPVHDLALG